VAFGPPRGASPSASLAAADQGEESHFTSVANEIVPIAPETLQDEIRAKKNNPALYESELFQAPSETDSNGSYKI
jgi:hypothetical protein